MSHYDDIISLRKKTEEVNGDGFINKAFAFGTKMIYKPTGWKGPTKIPYPSNMPTKPTISKMTEAAYDASPPTEIDGWELIDHTPTLKFYKKGADEGVPRVIVSVRGTADKADVAADLHIVANGLSRSGRYKTDLKKLKEVKSKYPSETFYGCGHSLGGAICDLFIKQGLIASAVTYNPAVEKSELKSTRNYRIYMQNDPLFNIGQYGNVGEVRKQPPLSPFDTVSAVQVAKSHLMTNFKGGKNFI
jgi:hypothetical protein